ncbi:MAG: cytochrome c biogenesis protein CcdA [Haloferacaceae archaeon]|jgi:cytochrome c-type biogenesis protein
MAGADLAVVAFAASAGVATFLAPCAYPLLPGYVGYYVGREEATLAGALARGLAATLGALLALGVALGVVLLAGRALVARVPVAALDPLVGVALVAVGLLVLTDRAPELGVSLPARRRSVLGFGVFGAGYGLAAAACVVPLLLGVATRALTLDPAGAAVAVGSYALAAALPLLSVTLLAAVGSDLLRAASGRLGAVHRVAGAVMVLAGLAQVWRSLAFLGLV